MLGAEDGRGGRKRQGKEGGKRKMPEKGVTVTVEEGAGCHWTGDSGPSLFLQLARFSACLGRCPPRAPIMPAAATRARSVRPRTHVSRQQLGSRNTRTRSPCRPPHAKQVAHISTRVALRPSISTLSSRTTLYSLPSIWSAI